jgi:HK97 gp10 family phage protein
MIEEREVLGLSDLLKRLDALPEKIERNVVRAGLREGMKVMARSLASNTPIGDPRKVRGAPVRGGDLLRSIRIRTRRLRGVGPQVIVGIGSKKAWYVHIVERGSVKKPDGWPIPKKRGAAKFLHFAGVFRTKVMHPGIKGQFFIRKTFNTTEREAVERFKQYLSQRLPRELGKLARQSQQQ